MQEALRDYYMRLSANSKQASPLNTPIARR